MDRYDAGEEIKPALIASRRGTKNRGSEQCALVHFVPEGSAQSASEVVHKVPKGSAQSAPNNTMIDLNNILSDSAGAGARSAAHAREAEEREFYKIFFLRNAGNPADEVRRFVGWYDSREWTDSRGRKYETPKQRAGLAYTWDCKSGTRLTPGENTEKFYKFLGSLYNYATKHGGIDPQLILDPRGGCRFKDGNFIWDCTDTVRQWFEALGPAMRIPLDKYIGEGCQLFYGKAS